jgi:hypothetical protein
MYESLVMESLDMLLTNGKLDRPPKERRLVKVLLELGMWRCYWRDVQVGQRSSKSERIARH